MSFSAIFFFKYTKSPVTIRCCKYKIDVPTLLCQRKEFKKKESCRAFKCQGALYTTQELRIDVKNTYTDIYEIKPAVELIMINHVDHNIHVFLQISVICHLIIFNQSVEDFKYSSLSSIYYLCRTQFRCAVFIYSPNQLC